MLLIFFGSQCKIQGKIDAQINFGHNFWLEGPTDLRSMPLSYIFHALFMDTPLGYVQHTLPNYQIAKYPNIWLIWLFGYLAAHNKLGQVGYPWKEHEKYSSEALTSGLWEPPVKSYDRNRFVRLFSLVFYMVSQKKETRIQLVPVTGSNLYQNDSRNSSAIVSIWLTPVSNCQHLTDPLPPSGGWRNMWTGPNWFQQDVPKLVPPF